MFFMDMSRKGVSTVLVVVLLILFSLIAVTSLLSLFKYYMQETEKKTSSSGLYGLLGSTEEGAIREGMPGCSPSWECLEWAECKIVYDATAVLWGEFLPEGKTTRKCLDVNNCYSDKIESEECYTKKEITIKKIEIDGKEYLEIYDNSTKEVIARLEEINEESFRKLNIEFII